MPAAVTGAAGSTAVSGSKPIPAVRYGLPVFDMQVLLTELHCTAVNDTVSAPYERTGSAERGSACAARVMPLI